MNKYMVLCLIFTQSSIMMGAQPAEKVVKRASDPKKETNGQKGLPIPQSKKTNRRTPEKSPRGGNSPFEFSPTASLGTVYYCGDFGRLSEYDFSPADSSK
jgi:hypothetical protein